MQIKNNTYIISGGASGLGKAAAETIIKHGGHVAIFDINANEGQNLEKKLGGNCLFVKADISSEKEVLDALEITKAKFETIHGLVNCAGIGPAKRVVGKNGPHELDFFEKVIRINLSGTFNMIRLVVNSMQHNSPNADGERGLIINTASIAAFDGQIGQAAYAASKGGIVAMTLPMAREFAKMGIRVMTIAPGIFETPLLANLPLEAQQSLGEQVPFPSRLGKPQEFADLVKHIIENPMFNGEVIRLDGALRLSSK